MGSYESGPKLRRLCQFAPHCVTRFTVCSRSTASTSDESMMPSLPVRCTVCHRLPSSPAPFRWFPPRARGKSQASVRPGRRRFPDPVPPALRGRRPLPIRRGTRPPKANNTCWGGAHVQACRGAHLLAHGLRRHQNFIAAVT
jgi:hypothetical protein